MRWKRGKISQMTGHLFSSSYWLHQLLESFLSLQKNYTVCIFLSFTNTEVQTPRLVISSLRDHFSPSEKSYCQQKRAKVTSYKYNVAFLKVTYELSIWYNTLLFCINFSCYFLGWNCWTYLYHKYFTIFASVFCRTYILRLVLVDPSQHRRSCRK